MGGEARVTWPAPIDALGYEVHHPHVAERGLGDATTAVVGLFAESNEAGP